MNKKISASIVNFNHSEDTLKLISQINSFNPYVSIFVVDNNSTIDEKKMLIDSNLSFTLIENSENLGFGKGHNCAIPKLESDLHFVINPDVSINERSILDLIDFFDSDNSIVMSTVKVLNADLTVQRVPKLHPKFKYLLANRYLPTLMKKTRAAYLDLDGDIDKVREVQFCTGCFFAIKTDVYKKLDGFDKRYFIYFEDADLSREAAKFGKVFYYPKTTVIHGYNRESKRNIKLLFHHIISMFRYFFKWSFKK